MLQKAQNTGLVLLKDVDASISSQWTPKAAPFGWAWDHNEAVAELLRWVINTKTGTQSSIRMFHSVPSSTHFFFILWFIPVYNGVYNHLLKNCFGNLRDLCSTSIGNRNTRIGN